MSDTIDVSEGVDDVDRWLSAPPVGCDLCSLRIDKKFIDGKTKFGPWACMCPHCHRDHGGELGLGKGQEYTKTFEQGVVVWKRTGG